MSPSNQLKLKRVNRKPQIKFRGIQKGIEVGEQYPLYNVVSEVHKLNNSTLSIATIKELGIKEIQL